MILYAVIIGIFISTSNCVLIPNDYCNGIADGIFLPSLNNCTSYYLCINNTAILGKCPDNFTFNAKEQLCDLPYRMECFQCPKNQLQVYPLEKTCNAYILCFDGKPIIRKCLDGLQFNNETGRCDFAGNLDCQENICAKVNNPKNIKLIASHSDCNKYYICHNGVPNPFYCAKGLYFNSFENECDLPTRANCPLRIINRSIHPSNKLPSLPSPIQCPSKGHHFIAYPKKSDHYIFCSNGKSTVLICSPGLIFDVNTTECRLPAKVQK